MSTSTELFDNSELSLAAYADLSEKKGDAFIFNVKESCYAKDGKSISALFFSPFLTARAQ